jgi:hypothetical protein
MKQREDAQAAIQRVNPKLIKFAVSVPLVVALSLVAVVSTGVTTVFAVGEKTGKEIIEEVKLANIPEYEIIYEIDGEGEIAGEMFQIVKEGESGTQIEAVPAPNWVFDGWLELEEDDPDKYNPVRTEENVQKHTVLTALFVELTDEMEQESEGEGDGEGESGEADQSEKLPSDQQGEGEQEGKPGDPNEGNGAGGAPSPNGMIIDGNTQYGDEIDVAQGEAESDVSQDSDMGDEVGDIIGDYYGSIQN